MIKSERHIFCIYIKANLLNITQTSPQYDDKFAILYHIHHNLYPSKNNKYDTHQRMENVINREYTEQMIRFLICHLFSFIVLKR
jgi:hypothetical protein